MLKMLSRSLIALMFILNGVAGFYCVICPLLPVLIISPVFFRKMSNLKFLGINVIGSGDFIASESSVILMNHRTRIDPFFLVSAIYNAIGLQIGFMKIKVVVMDIFRHIPFIGWIFQIYGYMFIGTRNWDKSRVRLSHWLDYIIDTDAHSQLILCPEGILFEEYTVDISNEYAKKHGLPEYKYVLHPRISGFGHIVEHLLQANYLDSIYDVTIGLPDSKAQVGWGVYFGVLPNEVHINVEKIAANKMPRDEVELGLWLQELWKQKEEKLKDFYENKRFPGKIWPVHEWNQVFIRVCYIIWNTLTAITLVLFIISSTFRLYAFCSSILFVILSFYDCHHLEIDWYRLRKSYRAKSKNIKKDHTENINRNKSKCM